MTSTRPRKELADVAFPDAMWTSFDRYDRYGAITRAVRACLGPGSHLVLDVGDAAGHLCAFAPELRVIGLDIEPATERLPGAVALQGDGLQLPFPDGTFDAVVSSDVLEHIPEPARAGFLAELQRVSRDLVVVAAPFDTPGVAGVEELVRRYALLALGSEQPQLEEHRANGLPQLDATACALGDRHWTTRTIGNGHLWDWLLMMLLRFQLEARPALTPLSEGYDVLYNLSYTDRSRVPPFYRHLVVARRGDDVDVEVGTVEAAPEPLAMSAVLAGLIAADSTEAARQDTVPRLDHLTAEVASAQQRIDQLAGELQIQSDDVRNRIADVRHRLEELFVVQVEVNAPLLRIKSRLLRVRDAVRRLTGKG